MFHACKAALIGSALLLGIGGAGPAYAQGKTSNIPGGGITSLGTALNAQVVPLTFATLSAGMTGRIERLDIREGQSFSANQEIVLFDCAKEIALFDKASAELALAQNNLEVVEKLNKLGSTSTLNLAGARANILTSKSERAVRASFIRHCKIAAPFAGKIAELLVRTGQFVNRGEPLMKIVDPANLGIEFLVPSNWVSWLKTGHKFTVRVNETGQTVRTEVDRLGAWIDPVSRSIKVYGRITGSPKGLIPGMSGRALLTPPAP
jgi:RND family efflux transporter MFP subunit